MNNNLSSAYKKQGGGGGGGGGGGADRLPRWNMRVDSAGLECAEHRLAMLHVT